jgi:hypothetical protein
MRERIIHRLTSFSVDHPRLVIGLTLAISAALGANIFAGAHETTSFGQVAKDDNVYLSVRFDF